MRGSRRGSAAILLAAAMLAAAPAAAQTRIAIGSFTGAQTCTTYLLTSGSESLAARHSGAAVADAYGFAAASRSSLAWRRTWRTDLVRDCQTDFAGLRGTVAAALGSAPGVVIVPPGTRGAMVLTGRVSPVGSSSNSYADASQASSSETAGVTVEFTLRGTGGAVDFGNSIEKRVTFNSNLQTAGSTIQSGQDNSSTYAALQRASAFAVARAVSFHVTPLRVVAATDRRVRLNYGSPLLNPGDAVILDGGVEAGMVRANVVTASGGFADIESEAGLNLSRLRIGSIVTFAEPEDPASRVPGTARIDLP